MTLLSTAKEANFGGSAIICPMHKPHYRAWHENSFYKF